MKAPAFPLAMLFGLLGTSLVLAKTPIAVSGLLVEPGQLTLAHAGDQHRLVVTGKLADGSLRDLTHSVQYVSAQPAIAAVSPEGVVRPVAAGQAVINIQYGGQTASIPVKVASAERRPVSFAHEVMPVLAKAGCNSGACHGSASGKKGFKVSLRGYDPAADYATLTRGGNGRRLNLIQPEQSLLLLKPTARVAHDGGKRFDLLDPHAQLLLRWIAEGATSDLATASQLVGLEVTPAFRTFASPGQDQQLLVTARCSDGSIRDVTGEARYSSSNENAARPGEDGLVRLPAKGEAAIMVRYGSLMAVSNLAVLKHNPAFTWTNPPENNFIDHHVFAKLRSIEVLPSELCSDEEFLRRVYLDAVGLPPTSSEVRTFLADNRADKRAWVIDALLERPEFAEFWAQKWADLFKLRFDLMGDKGTWGTYRWLRDSLAANKPFDHLVREIVTAEGSCDQNPPANFYRVFTTPDEAAEATAQIFLGVRVLCARCHDHPFEKWVQKDYYGLSAFFSQVGRKPGNRRQDIVIFRTEVAAQARHPKTGAALEPKYLDGASVAVPANEDGREVLARWLTRKDNPWLARATVNRLWSHLFGRGIIEPVDDIRSSNPPVNGPLLDALARDFLDHDFDVRHILRTMLNARTYQLSGRTNPFNAEDTQNFARYQPRRLSAEQLLDALSQITGVRETFRSRIPGAATVALPVGGLRGSQLPDRNMTADLLDLFGRPRGESSCSCERHDEASMTQALHLINGAPLLKRVSDPNGNLARLVKTAGIKEEAIIEELYLRILGRLPRPAEVALMQRHFVLVRERMSAVEDLAWALLNSKEFLFNH